MAGQALITAFYKGTRYSLTPAGTIEFSAFGGPSETKVSGIRHGPLPLHFLGRLSGAEFVPLRGSNVHNLPLLYGICYSGCLLKYRVESEGEVKILELRPTKSAKGFPYEDYPRMLPYVPLQLSKKERMSYAKFAASFSNFPDTQSAELVVVIPPPASVGVSLWGKWGDAEGVAIVFECDLNNRTVQAYNVCS
jgi:hypothetical protein